MLLFINILHLRDSRSVAFRHSCSSHGYMGLLCPEVPPGIRVYLSLFFLISPSLQTCQISL